MMNSPLVGAQLETEVLGLAIRCRESHSGWQREAEELEEWGPTRVEIG